jgi:ribosomal protein S12 methylthiotransferase
LQEAENLFKSGVKEILVVSQDTSAYGVDTQYRTGFWQGRPIKTRLLELAQELKNLARQYDGWIRLHYVYPYPSVDDIVPLMSDFFEHGNGLLPYLDIPLQHAHPDTLKRMKRPAGGEKALQRIEKWRSICPELVIRSTFIAGFPGETEEEFAALLEFIRVAELDRVGCFAYSPVDGATANLLKGALDQDVREERQRRFMAVAEEVSVDKLKLRVGKKFRVLVDSQNSQGGIARSYADAPEIDGFIYISPSLKISKKFRAAEFVKVNIDSAQGHDLLAHVS